MKVAWKAIGEIMSRFRSQKKNPLVIAVLGIESGNGQPALAEPATRDGRAARATQSKSL